MPLVEKRYGSALLEIAEQENAIDVYRADLQEIVELFEKDADFRNLLVNPKINTDVKKAILMKLCEGKIQGKVINFIKLILDKGRIRYLPGMLEEYIKLAEKKKNIVRIKIFTPTILEQKQIDQLKEKYKKIHKAGQVQVEMITDETLVGGIKVQAGDKVTDGSVKGRLANLKDVLVKG